MAIQFGLVVSGRPVQTNFQPVDVNKFALEIPSVEKINHLVIFLVGDPFPEGFAATVHILLPNSPWQLLGQLSNDKPSAIFRLSGIKHSSTEDMSMDDDNTVGSTATLGISIEPIDVVQQQITALPSSRHSSLSASNLALVPSNHTQTSELIPKILQNLYNYVMSFATKSLPPGAHVVGGGTSPAASPAFGGFGMVGMQAVQPVTSQSWIPVKAFEDWWSNVQRKTKLDPNYFWRTE